MTDFERACETMSGEEKMKIKLIEQAAAFIVGTFIFLTAIIGIACLVLWLWKR